MTPKSKEKAWLLVERFKDIIKKEHTIDDVQSYDLADIANLCAQLTVGEIISSLNGKPLSEVGYWANVMVELTTNARYVLPEPEM